MEEGGHCHAVATLPTGKRHGTLCIRGWMGPRASLDQCGEFRPSRLWSPACPAHSKSACASCGRNYGVVWLLVQECETSLTLYSHLILMDSCIVDYSVEIPTRCSFVIEMLPFIMILM